VTQNYLSADTFKVAVIPDATLLGGPATASPNPPAYIQGPAGEPVLLDRWGQVIQYFPRYGPVSNRTNDSSLYTAATAATKVAVQAGPLFGYSQPLSVEPLPSIYGEDAIWDWRDGAPYFAATPSSIVTWKNPVTGNVDQLLQWPDPTNDPGTGQPELAIEWMLGDLPTSTSGTFNNAIVPGEKLNFDGPYILISAGPDGPERSFGGYCNFSTTTSDQLQKTFISFGNIYNFDHP
jgi:hypothetical protein